MASLLILIMPIGRLVFTAIAVVTERESGNFEPRSPWITEYCTRVHFPGNNNGSAFAGLNANTPFYNLHRGDRQCSSDDSGLRSQPWHWPVPCAGEAHSRWRGDAAYA